MGMFDDAVKNSVPGGNLATPIAVAVGALILGKMFGGGGSPAPSAPGPGPGADSDLGSHRRSRLQHPRRPRRPHRTVDGGRRGPAGQLLGRPWTQRADPARPARRGARRQRARRDFEAHRHEPAGIAAAARGRPAAGDQRADAQRAGADDARRSRAEVSRRGSDLRLPAFPGEPGPAVSGSGFEAFQGLGSRFGAARSARPDLPAKAARQSGGLRRRPRAAALDLRSRG